MLSFTYVLVAALLRKVHAVNSLVALDYTSYQGTALPGGITQWLGMRYAAPPLGNLRFAAPQDPLPNYSVQQATTHGLVCLATGANPNATTSSEDCLFLDLYAPSNATTSSKLPVFFFIQGGGFNTNSNPNLNGSGLIQASGMDIIVVTFNYRVGPYGFLAGAEIESLNNGLKDQLKALQWVQNHISQFGGNPNHVTIGGDSAGAASVSLLLSAYGGKDLGLFQAAAAESVSFATVLTVEQSQFSYNGLVIRTQCVDAADTLACLRNLSAYDLQIQNYNTPDPGAQIAPLYMYSPTLDGDLVPDLTYTLFTQGKFQKVPTIIGDDVNGGTVFVPKTTATQAQCDTFLQAQFPFLTLAQLRQIHAYYPQAGTPQFDGTGAFWRACANAYGDMRYKCPGEYISSMYRKYGVARSYNYLWNVTDPTQAAEGYGVPHTVELNAIFGPTNTNGGAPASYYPGGTNDAIVPLVQSYWTSFIKNYNPNPDRLAGSPVWGMWTQDVQRRLVFRTNATEMQRVDAVEMEHCAYFEGIGVNVQQ